MPILAAANGLSADIFYAACCRNLCFSQFFKKVVILCVLKSLYKYANIGGVQGPLGWHLLCVLL